MRILIAEDDATSRKFLMKFLAKHGECDLAVDGMEALDAYLMSLKENKPYDLICLDVMMPKVNGVKVLKAIRDIEKQKGITEENRVKVIITTALAEAQFVYNSFQIGCEAYASKPIDVEKFLEVMKNLKLIED